VEYVILGYVLFSFIAVSLASNSTKLESRAAEIKDDHARFGSNGYGGIPNAHNHRNGFCCCF
jgi:hypothetical protein